MGQVRGSLAGSAKAPLCQKPGFVAVGDAAQAFDPLSSQGIQQALQSGSYAGQALQYAMANPDAPEPFLSRYAQQMQKVWDTYQAEYQSFYAMEQRWPDAPFWKRRHLQTENHPPLPQPMNARDIL
jgi:flavin-dependent dehydrogenase